MFEDFKKKKKTIQSENGVAEEPLQNEEGWGWGKGGGLWDGKVGVESYQIEECWGLGKGRRLTERDAVGVGRSYKAIASRFSIGPL